MASSPAQVLFRSPLFEVGEFRCGPGAPALGGAERHRRSTANSALSRDARPQKYHEARQRDLVVLHGSLACGARRTRTADLLGAIQALSQLSYSPARA